jgi:molecular chaperone GrpE
MSDNEERASDETADAPPQEGEPAEETPPEQEEIREPGDGDQLLDRVRETDEDLADAVEERLIALAEERDELRERVDEQADEIEEREMEIEGLTSRLKRKQADFQNYKKRAKKRQEQLEARATENLVTRLVDVRDNLGRALEADHEDVESIREGVEMTLREFDRVLDAENVAEIDPDPGTAVDPQHHEVMMRVDSDQPADTVAEVYQPGYEMGGKVIRAAQVTVSEGSDGGDGSEDEASDEETAGESADGGENVE